MQEARIHKENTELLSVNKKRILFTLLSFSLIYLVGYVIDPFATYWQLYFQRSLLEIVGEWTITLMYCFIISEFSIYVHQKLDGSITWKEKPAKRLLIESIISSYS